MLRAPRSRLLAPCFFSLRAPRSLLLTPRSRLLAPCSLLLLASLAFGQFDHNPQEMNTREDLINSLIPGKPKVGKEKTDHVDPQKLPSHTFKDPTFSGSLLNAGLGSGETKLEKKNPATDGHDKSTGDSSNQQTSKAAAAAESPGQQQKQSSKTATANNNAAPAASDEAKAKPAKSDEKPAATAQSDTKPDGNH